MTDEVTGVEFAGLDSAGLSNYHSISNLVISCLIDHLTSNKLLNPHQSAYCKHHSTETALLCIHDHLINAIGSQKVSCLCLLDLSAAFDTIDHNILITHFSSWLYSVQVLLIISLLSC